ncbi:MAG: bifunctional precorrin-2 dehydrogenase/sirohydrochlorin ferrochelatase, partial [Bacteroidota bacterium]
MESINNPLYPVFFKLQNIKLLIVGAGEVGNEKLHFILKSSPNANITIVAPWANEEVTRIIQNPKYNIKWIQRKVEGIDISNHDMIVAATNFKEVNLAVYHYAKKYGKLINVADTPELCDFYMGSIVTRGNLKVAISTNGQSPTFAKRFRQFLEEALPESSNELIKNLKKFRDQLSGDR